MARDDAIKFLKDISLGIKYLENAYSNNQRFNEIPMKVKIKFVTLLK